MWLPEKTSSGVEKSGRVGRPNPIAAGRRLRATEPFLCTICVENPFCDVHVRARRDEGEGVLREKIVGSSSQFVPAVCEKLFSEKLFSEPGCSTEPVLEKPFPKDRSMSPNREVVLSEVVLREVVLLEDIHKHTCTSYIYYRYLRAPTRRCTRKGSYMLHELFICVT